MKEFNIYSNPEKIFNEMIKDINSAEKMIYLETYIFEKDEIGKKFLNALIKKAKQGIKIKLLIDAWGSTTDKSFFKELIDFGAEVRFFREFKYVIRIFSKNHERNHRKLLLIDNNLVYIGSLNISKRFLKWRELVLRIKGYIALSFIKSFMRTWELYGKFNSRKMKSIVYKGYEIIQDFPSYIHRLTQKKFLKMINNSEKSISIETPYFIPPSSLRLALSNAVKRGVKITIIVPYRSDQPILLDVLRDRYLGRLYKLGANIFYYKPSNLHSKLMIVDDKFFLFGSSNFDYRSFIHQYEINFFGRDEDIINSLKNYFNETLSKTIAFNYEEWKNRSSFKKLIELFAVVIRKFL